MSVNNFIGLTSWHLLCFLICPAPNRQGHYAMMLSDVCLSLTSGLKSRTYRTRKTKIGTEVAHVTRDSNTTFKVKRSKSPGRMAHRRWRVRRLQRWAWEHVGHGKLLLRCRRLGGVSAPTAGGGGGGISWRPPAYSLLNLAVLLQLLTDCFPWYVRL